MTPTILEGEYYFRKTEMVAGFRFSVDGTFQFFFTYGAVDRSAAGTFSVEGNLLKLKSDKKPGKDFTVTNQSRQGEGYSLKFMHQNVYLTENIRCIFHVGDQRKEAISDSKGRVQIDIPQCESIYIQHLLYPDIVTQVKDTANQNNHFELSLNPSLEQFSFKGIDFTIEDDGSLSCHPNYFLPMQGIRFQPAGV
jgi:hypothetical protein